MSMPPVAGDVFGGAGGEAAPGVCAWPAVAAAIIARRIKAAARQRPSETRKFTAAERRNMTCIPALLPVVSTGEDFYPICRRRSHSFASKPDYDRMNCDVQGSDVQGSDVQGSDDMEPDSPCSRFNHAFSLNH
jgi:hypothetical protein